MIRNLVIVSAACAALVATAAGASPDNGSDSEAATSLDRLRSFWGDQYGLEIREPAGSSTYVARMLAKARPDECYVGLGEENIYPFDFEAEGCDTGRPKVNESYVFGLAGSGDDLWFGTAPNMGCLVYGSIAEAGIPGGLVPFDTALWTCEYGVGRYGETFGLPDSARDWRPPAIYVYDTDAGRLHDVTPNDPRLEQTLGLRSAGSVDNIVFLAGPTVTGAIGVGDEINIFAFRADTRQYLGSATFSEYVNIRKWIEVGGVLYAGVRVNPAISPHGPAGAVLRWTGTLEAPFSFEVVGEIDGDAVELAEHEGRVFVSTWAIFADLTEEDYDYAGLWMSPPLGPDGLQASDADHWEKVWAADDYEQDEITARLYNGGALASFGGYLYWGTLHTPLSAGLANAQASGLLEPGADPNALLAAVLGSHRPISLFRGRNFGTESEVQEVLYGLETMPAYVENPLSPPERVWTLVPNKMGPPVYGPAGLGNWFNTYTWTLSAGEHGLLLGTMDWSHTYTAVMLPVILRDFIDPLPEFEIPGTSHGADLYVFESTEQPAIEIDRAGVGNYASYGVRTMLTTDDAVYLGMANAMNLMTDLADDRPEGGWELIRLEPAVCPRSRAPGDFTGDGFVGWADLLSFWSCYTGPCTEAPCRLALYERACCAVGDFEQDGDVDLLDRWVLQWLLFR
jgi:hypothetical protein